MPPALNALAARIPANVYLNVQDYGAVPDAYFTDGVATSASPTFTSATAAFTSADVGKTIVILKAGPSSRQDHHSTIQSVESATSVTLANNAGRSQSSCKFYISRSGDQTAAIQAAINAAAAQGGGIVFLPGVGYLTTGLTLKNRTYLRGNGMRGTMLHLSASANAPVITADATANDNAQYCGVFDLWVDGNRARQSDTTSTLNGVYSPGNSTITLTDASTFAYSGSLLIGTNRLVYQSKSGNVLSTVAGGAEGTTDASGSNGATVTQHRCHGIAFYTNPYNSAGTTSEDVDPHHVIQNVYVKNCKGDGVHLWGQSEIRVENVWVEYADHFGFRASFDTWFTDCTAGTSGRAGFFLRYSSVNLTNCKSFFSGGNVGAEGHGFFIEGGTTVGEGMRIGTSLVAQDNKAHGFYIRNVQRVVIQGAASTNSTTSAGTYVGVALDGVQNSIIDVACVDRTSGTATQQSALSLAETTLTNSGNQIRITHGAANGTSGLSTAIKSGSTYTGGNDIQINGMGGQIAPAFASSYTPDPYAATFIHMGALTNNLTVNAPSNAHIGCELEFRLLQDGTGGRTVTWNSTYNFAPAYADTGNTLNKVFRARFRYDGTDWKLVFMSQSATAGTYWC